MISLIFPFCFFIGDHERAVEAGQKGGSVGGAQQQSSSDDSEGSNLKADGTEDKRKSSEHGFGGNREFASEMGKKGGAQSN